MMTELHSNPYRKSSISNLSSPTHVSRSHPTITVIKPHPNVSGMRADIGPVLLTAEEMGYVSTRNRSAGDTHLQICDSVGDREFSSQIGFSSSCHLLRAKERFSRRGKKKKKTAYPVRQFYPFHARSNLSPQSPVYLDAASHPLSHRLCVSHTSLHSQISSGPHPVRTPTLASRNNFPGQQCKLKHRHKPSVQHNPECHNPPMLRPAFPPRLAANKPLRLPLRSRLACA